jgi:hypothetical protein
VGEIDDAKVPYHDFVRDRDGIFLPFWPLDLVVDRESSATCVQDKDNHCLTK